MAGLITSALDSVRNCAGSLAWGPLVNISKSSILSLLGNIQCGQLTVIEQDGTTTVCGNAAGGTRDDPITTLEVKRDAFWLRLALFADMGFAESYMLGEVKCPDLTAFFRVRIVQQIPANH
jgi:cyclopropane-fatty-acyl-phospholipid synthase